MHIFNDKMSQNNCELRMVLESAEVTHANQQTGLQIMRDGDLSIDFLLDTKHPFSAA